METVTIKGQDFTLVHNAICELRTVQERLTGVINEELAARLHSVIKQFEQGLEDAYSQDNAAFEDKMEHYSTVQQELGLQAIWSMFEVQDLRTIGVLLLYTSPSRGPRGEISIVLLIAASGVRAMIITSLSRRCCLWQINHIN